MSDDINLDGVFEALGEMLSSVFQGSTPVVPATSSAQPVAYAPPLPPQENPIYPIGSKWRVRENEWWDNVTVDDVMVVKESTKKDILFSHPRGGALVVPVLMITDFERISDDAPGPQKEQGPQD